MLFRTALLKNYLRAQEIINKLIMGWKGVSMLKYMVKSKSTQVILTDITDFSWKC